MTDDNGWIKLHRKVLKNIIVTRDADYYAVWSYLLLNAAHASIETLFNGKRLTLKPGQLITGRKSISKFWKSFSESKTQRILKCFESEQLIEQVTNRHFRLVTVLNWDRYQQSEQVNEQVMNNYRTTNEQVMNTNKNVKNVKNDKNNTITKVIGDKSPAEKKIPKNDILEKFKEKITKINGGIEPVSDTVAKTRYAYWNCLQRLGVRNGMTLETLPPDVKQRINLFLDFLKDKNQQGKYNIESIYTLKTKLTNFLTNYINE